MITTDKLQGKVAGLAGRQIQPREIARMNYELAPLWRDAETMTVAIATCLSESQGWSEAFHHNTDAAGNILSTDFSAWQINDVAHPEFEHEWLKDPRNATTAAYQIWMQNGKSFNPWYAYKNKVYLDDTYLQRACLGTMNYLAAGMAEEARAREGVVAGRVTPTTQSLTPLVSASEFKYVREQLWSKRQ